MKEEQYSVRNLRERAEKKRFIEACDSAFTISVVGRSFYQELLDKIDRKAVMLGLYEDADEPVGYSAFYANDPEGRKAFLTLFCVRPEWQRQRLGELLMRESLSEAARLGMETMALEVLEEDDGQIIFYRRMGFEETGVGKPGFLTFERSLLDEDRKNGGKV